MNLRTYLRLCLTLIAVLVTTEWAPAADQYKLSVVAEREGAIYEPGEQAEFLVTVTKDNAAFHAGHVSCEIDDYITDQSRATIYPRGDVKLEGKSKISATMTTPGFLRCRVTFQPPEGKKLQATAGVGFAPLKIKPSLPVPGDFAKYWADQKEQLAKIPAVANLTPVDHADEGLACFDVQVDCHGGAPVSGYLAKPRDAKPKSLPAILWVHGAGVRGSNLPSAVTGAKAGMLSMDINAHGIANGQPGKFYQDLNAGILKNYRYSGREHRETSYFRGMFLRLVRAIDFLTAQPEWDGKVVAVIGHSQGGGQALVAGGIDDRVTIIATGVPAICDHSGRAADRINGWPKLVPAGEGGKPDPKILEASRYVDAVNFASLCKADAIMSVGFIDAVCPPSSCYAAYNLLQGDKQIVNEPSMGHAAPGHIKELFFKRIIEHVAATKAAR